MRPEPTGTLNLVVDAPPSGDSDSPKGSIHFDPFETFSNDVQPKKPDFDFAAFNDAMDREMGQPVGERVVPVVQAEVLQVEQKGAMVELPEEKIENEELLVGKEDSEEKQEVP